MRPHPALFAVSVFCLLLAGCSRRDPPVVLFFYGAVCPSCEESKRSVADAIMVASAVRGRRGATALIYDVYESAEASDALIAAIERYQLPPEKQGLPLLIVDGRAWSGLEEVEEGIASLSPGKR